MDVASWYFENRGIREDTLKACGVRCGPTSASWEVGGATKIRRGFYGGEREFSFDGKPEKELWCTPNLNSPNVTFVCEGETDAMRFWQENLGVGYDIKIAALSGINFYDAQTFKDLGEVYFILDNDEGDYAHKAVNDSWKRISSLVPHARRIYLPSGYKDLCDYLDVYSVEDLMKLKDEPESYVFDALDLTKVAEPPEWVWDGKMARGDIVIFQSEPNMGKSFVAMGLSVAIVEGWGNFLGFDTITGRVLLVDEENPEDVIRNRYARLGLTAKGLPNLRVLHEQAVRLDRDPEKLRREVEVFKPDLIILDSLTRLHNEDENNAGAVSRLFNESIHPLARKLGATVLVIHHTNKIQSGNSFLRTRGSSDINGVVDAGYDFVEHEFRGGSQKMMLNYKNRRGQRGSKVFFSIEDTPQGTTNIGRLIEESLVL